MYLILLGLFFGFGESQSLITAAELDFAVLEQPAQFLQERTASIQQKLDDLTSRFRAQPEKQQRIEQVQFDDAMLEVSYQDRPDLIDPAYLIWHYAMRMVPGVQMDESDLDELVQLESEILVKAGFDAEVARDFVRQLRDLPRFEVILADLPQPDLDPHKLTQDLAEALFLTEINRHTKARQIYAIQILQLLTTQQRIKLVGFLVADLERRNQVQQHFITPPNEDVLAIWWSELQNR